MKKKSLGFIGGGRITRIFLQAFENKNADFDSIIVCDSNTDVLISLKNQFPHIILATEGLLAAEQDIVFIALHPPVVMETLDIVKEYFTPETVLVSLAPKITCDKLTEKTGVKQIARMIPNASSIINEGYNPFFMSEGVKKTVKHDLIEIFNLLGNNFHTAENRLEAYALISGMLPTYFWYQWATLSELGESFGLSKKESEDAVEQTVIAAAHTFFNSGLSYEQVMDLIPIKPLEGMEDYVKNGITENLTAVYNKIKT